MAGALYIGREAQTTSSRRPTCCDGLSFSGQRVGRWPLRLPGLVDAWRVFRVVVATGRVAVGVDIRALNRVVPSLRGAR